MVVAEEAVVGGALDSVEYVDVDEREGRDVSWFCC